VAELVVSKNCPNWSINTCKTTPKLNITKNWKLDAKLPEICSDKKHNHFEVEDTS
jgi:hypothetical protein